MGKKIEGKSKRLQEAIDNRETRFSFNFIMERKGIDMSAKVLLDLMCNDSNLNGKVTWAQATYAKKMGLSRPQINKWFSKFVDLGILRLDNATKDSKKKHYVINPTNIDKLKKATRSFSQETKSVTGGN